MRTKLVVRPARPDRIEAKNINPEKSVKIIPDHERERLMQEQYGREKLTLPSAKNNSEGEVMKSQVPQLPRNGTDRRADNDKKDTKKIQKVGHEAALAKVVYERRSVKVLLNSVGECTEICGELLEFDKYSVRLIKKDVECIWIFKSAMIGFMEEER